MFIKRNILIFRLFLVCTMIVNIYSDTTTRPCECPWNGVWTPVCGTDGKTYSNPLVLKCTNECEGLHTLIAHSGQCV